MPAKRKARKVSETRGAITLTCRVVRTYAVATADELRESLGELIGIIDRTGGFMTAEDQQLLRRARDVHGRK